MPVEKPGISASARKTSMKFATIAKRVLLFAAVNLLILTTISIILSLFHVRGRIGDSNYGSLMIFCLIWGMGGAFVSLAMSRLMAKWFMGVKVIDPETRDPQLAGVVQMVHELAGKAGLPVMPEVGIYESPDVNAFATGPSRSRSLVAVSTGLLQSMRREEVQGVVGHEIAHVANGDMVTMTLLQGVINAFVMFFARILAFAVSQAMRSRDDRGGGNYFVQFLLIQLFQFVFSILGFMVVAWFSRWREFRADAGGAAYAGRHQMIGALQRLGQLHGRSAEPADRENGAAAFQAFMIFGQGGGLAQLFATHPPIEQRIARLQAGQ